VHATDLVVAEIRASPPEGTYLNHTLCLLEVFNHKVYFFIYRLLTHQGQDPEEQVVCSNQGVDGKLDDNAIPILDD
jgi:hypothetical protein